MERGTFVVSSNSTAVTRLAKEIHDEFLICKICLDAYRNPKCLSCLHTFCEECIENHVASESTYKKYSDYREFTCPLCRKRTQLPVGGVKKLPDNFLVSSLSEVVSRQRSSRYPFCDICKLLAGKQREATSKCLDCAKLLCVGCVEQHLLTKVTSGHSLFDVEIEKDIECRDHKDEAVRFYCEPCDACVCVLCTFHEHKDHDISQFSDAVVKYKAGIETLLDQCRDKVDRYDRDLGTLNHCEELIRVAEQKIHDTAIEFIQEIRSRERQLVDELHNMYGPECMDYIEGRKDLNDRIENLRSTCSLTDVILNGKDIELLLLKKDVQEKLVALGAIDVRPPPATCKKVVRFIPGSLDFGYLHDDERPLISTVSRPPPMKWTSSPPDNAEVPVGGNDVTVSDVNADVVARKGVDISTQTIQSNPEQEDATSSGSSSNTPPRRTVRTRHHSVVSTQREPIQMSRPARHFVR